ncbi:MAG: DUF5666 domain-containing protein [Gammaproteobacteria bacterium]|nr:DUF5666 domain-containing protein [Gammaproteobacteria bacterium]
MKTKSLQSIFLVPIFLTLLTACGGGGGGGAPNGPGTIQIEAASLDAREGTVLNVRVVRSGGSAGVASINFATANGAAIAGSDYTAASGTLTWANQVSGNKTISIPITDDSLAELPESFTLTLSNVSGASLGVNASASINIIDNDTAPVAAIGRITELNSVTLNGIRYDTNATSVTVNGLPANIADLELGQVVTLEGEINFGDARGRADTISYLPSIVGPVEHIDAALERLLVMGQTVLVNADTVFHASIDPITYAGLSVGANVQISGIRNENGELVATRIEPDTSSAGVQVVGTVSGLDLTNMLFSIDRLTVDYSGAQLIDLPMGMPVNGLRVNVRGSLTNGILAVDQIAEITNPTPTPGERAHLSGIVTRFVSPTDFDLNGLPVTSNASTGYVNGVVDDLEANAEITVAGNVTAGGDSVVAGRVTFGRPVFERTAVTLDLNNFSRLSVLGLSRVTVIQGADYSVEATVATGMVNNVPVTQSGDTVTIGDNTTQLLSAIVRMPVLNQVDVAAGALADVTLRDFDQMAMTVNVGGVSILQGDGLMIGELSASVSGVSWLDLGGIGPIGSASIDIRGVSRAILNMDIGSTLTGSVTTGQGTGTSALLYYGTNTAEFVTIDALSSVIRLGDTRL